ncbi:hypothetical protein YC2023_079388 [Brassica napus]
MPSRPSSRAIKPSLWTKLVAPSKAELLSRVRVNRGITFSTIQIYKYLCGCGSKKNLCGRNIHEECIDLFDKTVRMVVEI